MRSPAVRVLSAGVLIAGAVALLAGWSSTTPANPPPAKGTFAGLVSIAGGRQMFLQCRGTGSPTVVLVSGLDAAADVWTGYQANPSLAVFARVARFTRVCAYDRPGTPVGDDLTPSRSTPVRQPSTAQDAASDLHALLQAAGDPGPYVLVGHSYGGLITRLYAGEYPAQVAGLVFVDAFAPQWQTALTPGQWRILKAITGPSAGQLARYPAIERLNFDASVVQARAARTLPSWLPVTVISRDTRTGPGDLGPVIAAAVANGTLPAFVPKDFGYTDDRAWDIAQDALAKLVPAARHITLISGHNIQIDHPQVVADVIGQVFTTARQQRGRIGSLRTRSGLPDSEAAPSTLFPYPAPMTGT
jgi:pimeloyl-ACP methyl ester carboxylesterase